MTLEPFRSAGSSDKAASAKVCPDTTIYDQLLDQGKSVKWWEKLLLSYVGSRVSGTESKNKRCSAADSARDCYGDVVIEFGSSEKLLHY